MFPWRGIRILMYVNRLITEMITLAREKGIQTIKANIYSFNKQSQKMFESVGFRKTDDEWYVRETQGLK